MRNNNFDYVKVILAEAVKIKENMIKLIGDRNEAFKIYVNRDEEVWECYNELLKYGDDIVESHYANLYLYALRLYMNGYIDCKDKQLILNNIDKLAWEIFGRRWGERVSSIKKEFYEEYGDMDDYGDDASDKLDEIFDECNDYDDMDDCNDCDAYDASDELDEIFDECNDYDVYDTTGVYDDCDDTDDCKHDDCGDMDVIDEQGKQVFNRDAEDRDIQVRFDFSSLILKELKTYQSYTQSVLNDKIEELNEVNGADGREVEWSDDLKEEMGSLMLDLTKQSYVYLKSMINKTERLLSEDYLDCNGYTEIMSEIKGQLAWWGLNDDDDDYDDDDYDE